MSNKQKENLKTAVIVILVLVIVFGGSFLASEIGAKNETYNTSSTASNSGDASGSDSEVDYTEGENIPESEQKDLNEIDIDEYLKLKKGSSKSIIFIARPGCSWCQLYTPIMKNVVYLYDIKVNHLNTDELTDDGVSKLINSDDYFSDGYGTPLTLIVQNNKIVDMIEGYTTKENTIQFFKDNGIIKE